MSTLDPSALAILGLIPTGALGFVAWLLLRAVKGVDKNLDALNAKVDGLASKDTEIQIKLAELSTSVTHLSTRVTHLEFLVNRGSLK